MRKKNQYHLCGDSNRIPASRPRKKKTLTKIFSLAMVLAAMAGPASAANKIWVGSGTTNSPSDGTWDTVTTAWSDGSTASANAMFATSDNAYFYGSGPYAITVAASMTTPYMGFLGNYTLMASSPITLTSQASPFLQVDTGHTATIGANVTVSHNKTGFFGQSVNTPGGTIIIDNGGSLLQTSANTWALDGSGTIVSVRTGGILRHAGSSSVFAIGASNDGKNPPVLSVDGGTVSTSGSTIMVGDGAGTVGGIVTVNSGSLSMGGSAPMSLGVNAGGFGILNLNGGTTTLNQVSVGGGLGVVNFNGGLLTCGNSGLASRFITNSQTYAFVRNGGAIFNNNGYNLSVTVPLRHSTNSADNAVDGGLTFNGSGTNTLAGANSYTGPTTVNGGLLLSSNNLFLTNGAALTVSNATLQFICSSAVTNFVVGTFSTLGTASTLNMPLIMCGTPPVQFPVIKYSSLASGVVDANNALISLGVAFPSNGGFGGYLTNNATAKTIDLVITQGNPSPVFSTQPPASATRYAGCSIMLNPVVLGATGYQWKKDNGNLSGATNVSLVLTNLSSTDAGIYTLVASNTSGPIASQGCKLSVVQPGCNYASAVVSNNPVAYYRLNEMDDTLSGTVPAADYAGGFDGIWGADVLNGSYGYTGPASPDFPGFDSGNSAAYLQSGNTFANSRIAVSSWNFSANTVTLVTWVRPEGVQNANAGLIFNRGTFVSGFNFTGNTDAGGNSTLGYTWNNEAGTYSWNSGLAPAVNQWSMVALTVTPTNATIYVGGGNGVAFATHTYHHVMQSFTGPIAIGEDPFFSAQPPYRIFNGSIDEVAVFNQALSYNQILAMYTNATGVATYPVSIISQPATQTNYAGQTIQFSVVAAGTPTITYQWQIGTNGNFVNLTDSSRIVGSQTSTLTLSNIVLSDAADYRVIVANPSGPVPSGTGTLTVNPVGAATDINMSVTQTGSQSWMTASSWSDGLSAVDSAIQKPGSVYHILAGGAMRTPATTNAPNVFPGDTLSVEGNGVGIQNGGPAIGALNPIGSASTLAPLVLSVKKLIMAGGEICSLTGSGDLVINGGEVNVVSNTPVLVSNPQTGGNIRIDSQLTGNGNVDYYGHILNGISSFQPTFVTALTIAGANNSYTGTWNVIGATLVGAAPNALGTNSITVGAQGALQTTYPLNNPNADLILNGRLNLTQNDTFKHVMINGVSLSPGTYVYQQLTNAYPANFPAAWTAQRGAESATVISGSITVIGDGITPSPGKIVIGSSLQLTWTNSNTALLESTNVTGPWVTNTTATSPYQIVPSEAKKFFRLISK